MDTICKNIGELGNRCENICNVLPSGSIGRSALLV